MSIPTLFLPAFVFFFAAVLALPGWAQSPAKFEYFTNTSGVRTLVPVGTAQGRYGLGAMLMDQAFSTDGGLVKASGTGQFMSPDVRRVPVDVVARVTAPSAAAAIGRFALKVATPLTVGVALYDLAKELDFELTNEDGPIVVTKPGQPTCVGGPCEEWAANLVDGSGPLRRATGDLACHAAAVASSTIYGHYAYVSYSLINGSYYCAMQFTGLLQNIGVSGPAQTYLTHTVREPIPGSNDGVTGTMQDFVDAIANKSGWPSSSNIARALKEALDTPGVAPAEINTPTVTGPATTPGTTTVTQNGDNTTTTTTTNNHTYQGATVTTTTTTNNRTVNNVTGAVTNETNTTVNNPSNPAAEVEPFEMPCGIAGVPACNVKIDEAGTPPPPSRPFSAGEDAMDGESTKLIAALEEQKNFDIGQWSFTFQFPTGCSKLPVYLGVELDPCQWQGMIHDLMSMIWLATGVFGMFSILRMGVH